MLMHQPKPAAPAAPFRLLCSDADRERWLAARVHHLGASETAAVMGVAPWGSALQVWATKTGRVSSDDLDDKEYVFWGRMLEEGIIRGYQERTGRVTVRCGIMLASTRWPWMSCTPDALVSDVAGHDERSNLAWALNWLRDAPAASDDHPALYTERVSALAIFEQALASRRWWPLQTKNIGFGSAQHWEDGVPVYYRLQCIHEALVCGSDRVTGAALVAGQKLAWDDIEVDPAGDGLTERQILNLTRDFWHRNVLGGEEPAADASDSARRTLAKLYPEAEPGKELQLGSNEMGLGYELERAKEAAKAADERVALAENRIRQLFGDAERIRFPDGSGFTLKTQTRAETVQKAATFRVLRRQKAKN